MGVSYNDDGCCRWGNHSPVSLRPFRGWHLLLNNEGKGLWGNSNHSIGVRGTLDYPGLKADMGRKFDKRLPEMTDAELASVDESTLDPTSRNELATERGRRAYATKTADRQDDTSWKNLMARIAIFGVIIAALALII